MLLLLTSCTSYRYERVALAQEYYDAAAAWQDQNDPGRAEKLYLKAVDLYPGFSEARFALAALYSSQGRFEDALAQANDLVSFNRKKVLPAGDRELLAYIFASTGQLDQALNLYLDLTEEKPSARVYFNLGRVYEQMGVDDSAFMYYGKARETDETFLPAAQALARFHARNGEYLDVILILQGLETRVGESALSGILLDEAYYQQDLMPEFLQLTDQLQQQFKDGRSLDEALKPRYLKLLTDAARRLADTAMDDERAKKYYTLLFQWEVLSIDQWKEEYDRVQGIPELENTRTYIEDILTRAEKSAESSTEDTSASPQTDPMQ